MFNHYMTFTTGVLEIQCNGILSTPATYKYSVIFLKPIS